VKKLCMYRGRCTHLFGLMIFGMLFTAPFALRAMGDPMYDGSSSEEDIKPQLSHELTSAILQAQQTPHVLPLPTIGLAVSLDDGRRVQVEFASQHVDAGEFPFGKVKASKGTASIINQHGNASPNESSGEIFQLLLDKLANKSDE
jgi:hypothetical protein